MRAHMSAGAVHAWLVAIQLYIKSLYHGTTGRTHTHARGALKGEGAERGDQEAARACQEAHEVHARGRPEAEFPRRFVAS